VFLTGHQVVFRHRLGSTLHSGRVLTACFLGFVITSMCGVAGKLL
jgi:hypothetical protein